MSIAEQQILMARLYLEKSQDLPGLVPGRGQKDPLILPAVSSVSQVMAWNSGRYDVDDFRSYLVDSSASEHVPELLEDDMVNVLDQNRRLVFANREGLVQSLCDNEVFDKLVRAIDLMIFYQPISRPETKRHVITRYILHKHPELDPGKVTIQTLPNVKMGLAYYG
ncbi:hypothetical protein PG993_006596 [Apiospora rasikravindrae]|uniref:Uncharacterized protein n=1 Tax=Apiospora rasikravindrae TaxID=990691 RepID=A0ABR1T655_9PEZI